MTRYAVNEIDQITVYDTTTQDAVCVCGPDPDFKGRAFPDEQTQRVFAVLIAKLLNEGAK